MAIKEQFRTLKNNWLIILIILVLVVLFLGGFPSALIESFKSGSESYSSDYNYGSSGGGYAEAAPNRMLTESAPMPSPTETGDVLKDERKITTTTNLNTQVESGQFMPAAQKLKSIIIASSALLLQEDVARLGEDKKAYYDGRYSLKVESSTLDAVVAQLKEIGKVTSFTQAKEDITEPYLNLEIEIKVEKERLARYQKILSEAQLVEDKITLNDKIFDQERTIKYYEDTLKNADQQVRYSTVYMEITEKAPAYANLNWVSGSMLLVGFVDSLSSVITMVVVVLPYAAVILLIWLAIRWIRGRSAKKK